MSSPPDQYQHDDDDKEPAMVVIAGAGIVGLVLALALQKHVAITAEVYEKVAAFHDDVGVRIKDVWNRVAVSHTSVVWYLITFTLVPIDTIYYCYHTTIY